MLKSFYRQNQSSDRAAAFKRLGTGGYTIIETIIVLAMAGIILLLVFRAIPTLQRGSRNNQREEDVQLILESVSRYELNNAGGFPHNCGQTSATACTQVEGGQPNDYFLRFASQKLTFYIDYPPGLPPTSNMLISLTAQSRPGAITHVAVTQTDHVTIQNYRRCDTPIDGGATNQGAGYNDVVALYAIETGSGAGFASQCHQL